MKKLFSSILAATMVAGMAVTACAEEPSSFDMKNFDHQDYGLIGAYDEDGVKLDKETAKLDGGDKIYFPILVSGDEIDDEHHEDETKMYFATKRSEIDDLKASVKDEVGGKYIDNADIVKKDIEIDDKGNAVATYQDTFADHTVASDKLDEAAKKADSKITVTDGEIVGGANEDGTITKTTPVVANIETAPATTEKYTVAITPAEGTAANSNEAIASITGNAITVIVYGGWDGSAAEAGTAVSADKIKAEIEGKISETTKTVIVSVSGTVDADGNWVGEAPTATAKGSKAATTTPISTSNIKFVEKKAEAGKDSKGSVTASWDGTDLTFTITGENSNAYNAGTKLNKIYCVEVEMSDYFKNEETEVEFNIQLKNSGRTEFDTDDDKVNGDGAFFNGTFDLGSDSETLEDNGFYPDTKYEVDFDDDGDLELEIGPDTRSVQLDEAIVKENGKDVKYDIEKIFLESADEIDCAFTFDVKASGQDDLYLELNDDAVKDLAVSNQKADLTFFNFPGEPEFDFSGDATFAVEDDDEDYYFYEIVDGELVETNAKYDSRDGVFKLRTNKLGSYVISDKELDTAKEEDEKDVNDKETKTNENGGGDATADAATPSKNAPKANANTGAADLIGVASALAVVSVAAAGAVALKK